MGLRPNFQDTPHIWMLKIPAVQNFTQFSCPVRVMNPMIQCHNDGVVVAGFFFTTLDISILAHCRTSSSSLEHVQLSHEHPIMSHQECHCHTSNDVNVSHLLGMIPRKKACPESCGSVLIIRRSILIILPSPTKWTSASNISIVYVCM